MTEQEAKQEAQERGTEVGCGPVAAWVVVMMFALCWIVGLLMNLVEALK
jgi:hypothetical protein